MDPRQRTGRRGEDLAAEALAQAGLTIRARNWRSPVGEIDIVAEELAPDVLHGGRPVPWLVLVEVRTRRGTAYGSAREAFTPRKQEQLRRVAAHYVQETGWTGPWRIDAVAVQLDTRGRLLHIEHIRHAITG